MYRRTLIVLVVLGLSTLTTHSAAAHLLAGVKGVNPDDEFRHYGDEDWGLLGFDSTFPKPISVGFVIGSGFYPSPKSIVRSDPQTVVISNDFLQFTLRPNSYYTQMLVLKVYPTFQGVEAGDVIEVMPYSQKAYWYNLGVDKDIAGMTDVNGYELIGTMRLTRGGITYEGSGEYYHWWGNQLKKVVYRYPSVYEHWTAIVTDLFSLVIWHFKSQGGEEWKDGGILFHDDDTYDPLGTTVAGFAYTTTDYLGCAKGFDMIIETHRGRITLSTHNFAVVYGGTCDYTLGVFDVTTNLDDKPFKGRGMAELQRQDSSATPKPTALTLSTSPNPSKVGETVVISGRLADNQGVGISEKTILPQTSPDQINWSTKFTVMTDQNGLYSLSFQPKTTGTVYARAVFRGDSAYSASTSPTITHQVIT